MHFPVSSTSSPARLLLSTLADIPHREISVGLGGPVAESGRRIDQVFLVRSGLLSLLVDLCSGDRIETAMLGSDDVLGASAPLGRRVWLHSVIAQSPAVLWVYDVGRVQRAMTSSEFVRLLYAQESWLLAQASQTAACNAKHSVSQRLATWLLRAQDVLRTDELNFTQDFLCHMLGVQRPTLTITASRFQDDGAIRYRRGVIRIDRTVLAGKSCGCYRDLRAKRAALFGPDALAG